MHLTAEQSFILLMIYLGAYICAGIVLGGTVAAFLWYEPRGKRFALWWGIGIGAATILLLIVYHWSFSRPIGWLVRIGVYVATGIVLGGPVGAFLWPGRRGKRFALLWGVGVGVATTVALILNHFYNV